MLIYHSLNPRTLRGCNKASLPAIWGVNKKSRVTQALFEDWFKSYFCQAVVNYCKQNNLTFKFLLVLDSVHPTPLNGLCETVKSYFCLRKLRLCYWAEWPVWQCKTHISASENYVFAAALNGLCDNVNVVFLPPKTTSLLQPMGQGII
jgi:hypothetical protein